MSFRVICCFLLFTFGGALRAETLTSANIQGQKNLFQKGWFIIASPVEAWNFAKANGEQSQTAFLRALEKAQAEASSIEMKKNLADAQLTLKKLRRAGEKNSSTLSQKGTQLFEANLDASSENFKKAWKKINLGYVHYGETNKEDFQELVKVNREFFQRTDDHFKTMDEVIEPLTGYFEKHNEVEWKKHFKEGQYKFEEQYEASGKRGNSITALWDVLLGYAKFAYHAVVQPSAKVAENGIRNSGYYTTSAILRTFIVSHNIVYSLGANLYYTTKLGYKLVSPSVEAGLLASLALINVASGPATWGTLKSAGVINKVAVEGVAPVVAGTQYALTQASDGTQKAAIYLLHGTQGAAEVGFEKIESGVALGYSALSQIPPQLLLTSVNAVIFLVVDGPRLILASARGKIGDKDITEIPAGSVMDMKKLKENGVDVVPITNDEFILKKVLQYAQ